jgi:hypothetical protein
VKFIPPPPNKQLPSKQTIGFNEAATQKQVPSLQLTSVASNSNTAASDFFSNKIKKGVFDLKRFSKTERNILAPHSNAGNMPNYATQHKLIIKHV